MISSYSKFFKNYVNFKGETNRRDYWLAFLMNSLIYIGLFIILTIDLIRIILSGHYESMNNFNEYNFIFSTNTPNYSFGIILAIISIYGLVILIPSIAITIRRLRDGGYHWGFIFLCLIPSIGNIVLLILMCMPNKDEQLKSTNSTRVTSTNPDELIKWHELQKSGAITPEEYEAKKKEFL